MNDLAEKIKFIRIAKNRVSDILFSSKMIIRPKKLGPTLRNMCVGSINLCELHIQEAEGKKWGELRTNKKRPNS
jgi:hypothetical protein